MTEPRLIPVPRGMCGAFYQFMGAGAPRGDDGQIMMLNPMTNEESEAAFDAAPEVPISDEQMESLLSACKAKSEPSRCPTCDSPDPKRHPAMQFEGEVEICKDSFHATN